MRWVDDGHAKVVDALVQALPPEAVGRAEAQGAI